MLYLLCFFLLAFLGFLAPLAIVSCCPEAAVTVFIHGLSLLIEY
jgi:hypothetical protein